MTTVTNRNGIEFDIDAIATDLNNKVDLDGTNATYPHVVSRTPNSQGGGVVEIWSDGYCVQTGCGNFAGGNTQYENITINLTQAYKDTSYTLTASKGNGNYYSSSTLAAQKNSTNQILISYFDTTGATMQNRGAFQYNWRTEGFIR